jgi:hypothetical protein
LNGKTYHIKDKKLELSSDATIRFEILSNDVCYTDSMGTKNFKRIIVSNSLDSRFYNKSLDLVQDAVIDNSLRDPLL